MTFPSGQNFAHRLRYALRTKGGGLVKADSTRLYLDNRLKLLGVCACLAILAVMTFPRSHDAVAEAEVEIEPAIPPVDLTRHDLAIDDSPPVEKFRILTLKPGDSLGLLLQKNGIEPTEAYKITQAFSNSYDPRRLKAGESLHFFHDNGQLAHLGYKPSIDRTVMLSRTEDGNFISRDIMAEFKSGFMTVRSEIGDSLYLDAKRLGVPDKIIQQFANIYEYSVDFQRDIQPGDGFEMFLEVVRDRRGNVIKTGDLLFTGFSPRGKVSEYYLFYDAGGRGNFYDAEGKTARRKLRATPINGARLSSGFGSRRHPILGYRKMHSGVDFAAPTGTPVLAAGNGTVEKASRYGGYGNYIRIRHTDGYKTAYAHLSKFARGIRAGTYVTQDQVIGYVGSTGRSTGPHLHYEVHRHGKKINPRRLSQLSGEPLAKEQMSAFETRRSEIDAIRAQTPVAALKPVPAVENVD
ncbi:MAG: M23 family metallopeptidase [Hyphomonadaceae bacterium]|nr:M23 family metallopeptidase [Hyphomonadaceae bacterium]